MINELLLATHNAHKVAEIRAVMVPGIKILSMTDIEDYQDLPETGNTLEENATQKAREAFGRHQVPCAADDSGLEVVALEGAPGVYSARYAGPQRNDADNIRLLLERLGEAKSRSARFRTVIALALGKSIHLFEGCVEGSIAYAPRGSNGFGYDPVFIPQEFDLTFAEMTLEEKNRISHRAAAISALVKFLKEVGKR